MVIVAPLGPSSPDRASNEQPRRTLEVMMESFADMRLTEYVASSQDFPHLTSAFQTFGAKFKFPGKTHPDRSYYLFDTLQPIERTAYPKESARLNQLLADAKEAGFAFLIIHARASSEEAKKVITDLLTAYHPGDWYPEAPDTYHDSGYFYSDTYIKTTPVYHYLIQQLEDHRPPIKLIRDFDLWEVTQWIEDRHHQALKRRK